MIGRLILIITVKSAYREHAYTEHPDITDFHSLIFTKELVQYTFIRNSGYKKYISMVPISSL